MSLSFYYEFTAPASTSAWELETFLRGVEHEAKAIGFNRTAVLNVPFDTPERREFANRLGGYFTLQDEWLKGVSIPAPCQLHKHIPNQESADYSRSVESSSSCPMSADAKHASDFSNSRSASLTSTVRFSRTPGFKAGGGFGILWIHPTCDTGQLSRNSVNGDLCIR